MYDFEFLRPTTIDAAVSALQDEDAQALAGGQTLLPTMKARLAAPETQFAKLGRPVISGKNASQKARSAHEQGERENKTQPSQDSK